MMFSTWFSITRRQFVVASALAGLRPVLGDSVGATYFQDDAATAVSGTGYGNPEFLLDADNFQKWAETNTAQCIALMPESSFEQAHIPDSIRFDWPDFDLLDTSSQDLVEAWADDVLYAIAAVGFDPGHAAAMYDDGTMFSARLWWVLELLGSDRKSVLNGGIAAWGDAGNLVETGTANKDHGTISPIGTSQLKWDAIALLPEVAASIGDPDITFLDVRGVKEYRDGHIPGAIDIPYTLNAVDGEPGEWKSQQELMEMYAAAGVSPDRLIIPYCSSGVRSAVTWFTLRVLGFENVSLFTGSWREWSSHPELPVTLGEKP